ncbi:hypothetical protein KXD40_007230 [Peronospora effusa]|uniref:Uncharacterized protein n=1 Tax=Peronospora effusa TaxID=542832 RepID=A0A3M6V8D1_9STRA|nr:hypothetical protein DD238_007398 [Peronospora effusa]RQM12345.1 hypothetical protein DD237_007676 [Peronospora effusa]UIZ28769.1 hypothetical protein KXD40_007230 [Peronospora effusa]
MNAKGQMFSNVLLALLVVGTLSSTLASETNNFCSSVTSCLEDGNVTCDTTTGNCPPCIYELDNLFTCWKKDKSTNTCPFTGVRYDCSDSWSSTTSPGSSSSATNVSSSDSVDSASGPSTLPKKSSSSFDTNADELSSVTVEEISTSLITYGAISLGAFFALVILIILCARRRKMRRSREENIAATEAGNLGSSDRRLRSLSKPHDDASAGPYNNVLDTSKVNCGTPNITSSHKGLQRGSIVSRVPTNESLRSFDGMLADSSDFPAVLGNKAGLYKSGGRSGHGTSVAGSISRYSNVGEYVQQDVSLRCTSTPDVFGEYLRMKQEMQYDDGEDSIMSRSGMSETISDLNSSQCSLVSSQNTGRLPQRRTNQDDRSSMAGSFTDSIANSVTDSEYAEARGESDCFSEMSYNDERYSFSSIDGLDDSQIRVGKREVEI